MARSVRAKGGRGISYGRVVIVVVVVVRVVLAVRVIFARIIIVRHNYSRGPIEGSCRVGPDAD
jgi:glutamate dehydrogenase/leucine dehydrogenase